MGIWGPPGLWYGGEILFGSNSIITKICNAGQMGLCTCTVIIEIYNI